MFNIAALACKQGRKALYDYYFVLMQWLKNINIFFICYYFELSFSIHNFYNIILFFKSKYISRSFTDNGVTILSRFPNRITPEFSAK